MTATRTFSRDRELLRLERRIYAAIALLAFVSALIVLMAGQAHAQTLSISAPSLGTNGLIAVIAASVLAPLTAGIFLHLNGALPALIAHLKVATNIKGHEEVNAIKDRALDLLAMAAHSAMVTAAPDVQQLLAAGVVTPQAKMAWNKLRGDIIDSWTKHATPQGLADDLQHVVFGGDQAAAVNMLSTQLLAWLPTLTGNAQAPAPTPTPASAAPSPAPTPAA